MPEGPLGANRLCYDTGYQYLVRVTGYPEQCRRPDHLRQLDLPGE